MSTAEKIQGINFERVQWCCDEYDMTLCDLSQRIKIALPTFEKALAGEACLSANQLSKIARFFNRGLLFFFEVEPVNETKLHTTQFRTLTNQKPNLSPKLRGLVERVEKQRETFIGLLEDLGEAPSPIWEPESFPREAVGGIRESAHAAREWLGLGASETFESYRKAVEATGALVFVCNGYQGKWQIQKDSPIRGFSLYYPSHPVIVIKKQVSEGPQVFTLMHELGHLLLHKNSFIDDESDLSSYQGKEKSANAFAGHLLVPDLFLDQLDPGCFPVDDVTAYDEFLSGACRQWSVSGEVIVRRLLDSGFLQRSHYENYRAWKQSLPLSKPKGGGRAYRYREPLHMFGERYVGTVFDALRSRNITLTKASTYLDNLKIPDLHRLERMNVHF